MLSISVTNSLGNLRASKSDRCLSRESGRAVLAVARRPVLGGAEGDAGISRYARPSLTGSRPITG
jgi:hypothetical protein